MIIVFQLLKAGVRRYRVASAPLELNVEKNDWTVTGVIW